MTGIIRGLRRFFAWAIRAARKVVSGLRKLLGYHDGGFVAAERLPSPTSDQVAFVVNDSAPRPYPVIVKRHPQDGAPFYCAACGMGFDEYMACELGACQLESQAVAEARQERGLERLLK